MSLRLTRLIAGFPVGGRLYCIAQEKCSYGAVMRRNDDCMGDPKQPGIFTVALWCGIGFFVTFWVAAFIYFLI